MSESAMRRQSDHNKELMERFYAEVANAGNLDLIDELFAPDFVEHEEIEGLEPTREGVKQFFAGLREAFPDLTFTLERAVAEENLVAAQVTIRGTHRGEFMGIPGTGRAVEFVAMDFVQFADGAATAHWGASDMVTMLTQLGVMPEPG
jgi:steroid delta-isomerase-like uncharacterized protein